MGENEGIRIDGRKVMGGLGIDREPGRVGERGK